MDAWDIFCMTGRIDDYLHYRRGLDGSVQQTAQAVQKEVPTHGDPVSYTHLTLPTKLEV